MAIGTPLYAAPEVFDLHEGIYDQKCDVWSTGAILYELLTSQSLLKLPSTIMPQELTQKFKEL